MMRPRARDPLAWHTVYGATIAAQVRERFAEGKGAPSDEDMERYVEEAVAVADMATSAAQRLWT